MKQTVLVCGGRDYDDARSLGMVLDAAHSASRSNASSTGQRAVLIRWRPIGL
ncbi:DUF2493 domain-containing protein [Bradyrhizobium sp. 2]|uniref:DUF2493 domain-containing protein n=1 Tax=Bradyrhizobium sp. 2 TaxID=190045 RepID=UPI001FF99C85|nr:DUF2493 domain-containing protein [Bradyrhizobium sp. 2]